MFSISNGLRTKRYAESLLLLCLCLTFFTACEEDEALLPTSSDESSITLNKRDAASADDASAAEMEDVVRSAQDFDDRVAVWRKGSNTRDRMESREAADQLETLINMKIASGVGYKDEQFARDSVEVPGGRSWTGETVARVYEATKEFLISRTSRLRGRNPGVRFVSVSPPRRAEDGATRVYLHASIGSDVQVDEPQAVLSHYVWGSANTTPATCTTPAETQIASLVNFELDACYTGNPVPPLGSCGFFSIVTIGVNPFGGTAGIPADFTYENRDWPSGTPASNAPAFTNEGEFVWHQDNDRDEICFNLNKLVQYYTNQVDVIEGPMDDQAESLPGFLSNFRRPMGEFILTEEFELFANGQLIVDFNAHYAFIDYGVRFFFVEAPFELASLREL